MQGNGSNTISTKAVKIEVPFILHLRVILLHSIVLFYFFSSFARACILIRDVTSKHLPFIGLIFLIQIFKGYITATVSKTIT